MKRMFPLLILLHLVACARTAPLQARWRDALDIPILTAGGGVGAKARVGPLHLGLIGSEDMWGLRNGIFLSDECYDLDFFILPLGGHMGGIFAYETFPQKGFERQFSADTSYFPCVSIYNGKGRPAWKYYSDVEVKVALGLSARVGFSVMELLDFMLSWTGVDIMQDDGPSPPQPENANPNDQSASPSKAP